MTTAAMPTLRPLGLGELLDQAIRLYRRNFFKFIGIVAVVQVPLALIQFLVSISAFERFLYADMQDPADLTMATFSSLGQTVLIAVLSLILVQGVATAALTRAIADSRLGQPTGILEAYRKIGSAWSRLIGALLLIMLLAIGLLIWMLVPCIGWFTGPGMLAVLGFLVSPLVAPVIVLESKSATQAIRRAWDLARRRFWWMLGFVLILSLLGQFIITGPSLLIGGALGAFSVSTLELTQVDVVQAMTQSLTTLVLGLIYLPLQLTAITLLYFDLRVRTEGLDLALQSESIAGQPVDFSNLIAHAPPASSGGVVTGTEMAYFALLTVGFVFFYMIVFGILTILGMVLFSAGGAF